MIKKEESGTEQTVKPPKRLQISLLTFIGWMGIALYASSAENGCPNDAQVFWKSFRMAVIKNKIRTVADMSGFPFKLKGPLDASLRKELQREEFLIQYPKLLDDDPGLSSAPSNMKALITETAKLSPSLFTPDGRRFRVGNWVYELRLDGWRFVQAYIEE